MEKLHSWWKTYVKSIRKDLVFMLLADLIFLIVMKYSSAISRRHSLFL